jgi:hypothetical protein
MGDAQDFNVSGAQWQGDQAAMFSAEGFNTKKKKAQTGHKVAVQKPRHATQRNRGVQGTLDWVTGPEQYAHSMLEAEPGEEKTNPSWELLIQWLSRPLPGAWRFEIDVDSKTLFFVNSKTSEVSATHPDHEAFMALLDFGRLLAAVDLFDRVQMLDRSLLLVKGAAGREIADWSGPHRHGDGTHFWYCAKKKLVAMHDPRTDIRRRMDMTCWAMRTIVSRLGVKPEAEEEEVDEEEEEMDEEEKYRGILKSKLYCSVPDEKDNSSAATPKDLTLPAIDAKGPRVTEKKKKTTPEEAEAQRLQEEMEKRKAVELKRIERAHAAEDRAILRTSKDTVEAAHVAKVKLLPAQEIKPPLMRTAVAPPAKTTKPQTLLDYKKTLHTHVSSREFWNEEMKPQLSLATQGKSSSLPSIAKSSQGSQYKSVDTVPSKGPSKDSSKGPSKGPSKPSNTSAASAAHHTLRRNETPEQALKHEADVLAHTAPLPATEADVDAFLGITSDEEEKPAPLEAWATVSPSASQEFPSGKARAGPRAAPIEIPETYRTEIPEIVRKVHLPKKKKTGLKKLAPLRSDSEGRHQFYFTGAPEGPVKDGVTTTRALNAHLKMSSTRMSRARMIQAVEAHRLAQVLGYTGAAVQVLMNPGHRINRAEVDAAQDPKYDIDSWSKFRPDLVEGAKETFHTAGKTISGRYVSEKGLRSTGFDSVKSGEISEGWEAKVDAFAGEGVTVEHAME